MAAAAGNGIMTRRPPEDSRTERSEPEAERLEPPCTCPKSTDNLPGLRHPS